ncbi:hypothetical protein, partial [Bradyrhizobium liaoningense]|uniref:hypothetical protein n=1 Tax=Bradyrhizobium liaoningense TaxID=43992 RepID=UPI0039089FF9
PLLAGTMGQGDDPASATTIAGTKPGCATEENAKLMAEQLVDVHPVELWEGPRRIARFEPKH